MSKRKALEIKNTKRILYQFTAIIIGLGMLIFAGWSDDYVVVNETQAWNPVRDVCELETVQCPNEPTDVDTAIQAVSDALGKQVTKETEKRIQYLYDNRGDVPFFDAVKTIYCESMWYAVKSYLPENSYGIAQIHLDSHTDVTQAQALDAYFSIDWLVEHWNSAVWYGYDRATGTCTNDLVINL